jgi:hypothetical protein
VTSSILLDSPEKRKDSHDQCNKKNASLIKIDTMMAGLRRKLCQRESGRIGSPRIPSRRIVAVWKFLNVGKENFYSKNH